MYRIKTKNREYTLPKENLVMFAKTVAYDRGHKAICMAEMDDIAAKEYLKELGIEVKDGEHSTL